MRMMLFGLYCSELQVKNIVYQSQISTHSTIHM